MTKGKGEAVSQEKYAAAFEAHISPQKAEDQSLSLWAFVFGVLGWAKQLAKEQVDTEEERDAIVDGAMLIADRFVASKFSIFWVALRPVVREGLDYGIDFLPQLLE